MSNKLKRKRKKENSIWNVGTQFLGYLLDGMICIYMLLVIVVMPFYNEQGFAYIGSNKATFFRKISVTGAMFLVPAFVLYLIFLGVEKAQESKRHGTKGTVAGRGGKSVGSEPLHTGKPFRERCIWLWRICRKHLSVTDMFAILYGVSLLLSYLCSEYRRETWLGTVLWGSDGWYMGLLPQIFLLGIYFVISRFWRMRSWMCLLFLPVSGIVFLLGYLNRFGIYPIDMGQENPSFLSTIGNINWYCGYLVSVFFGGYYLLWKWGGQRGRTAVSGKKLILLVAYVTVGFATLVTQGSLSGLVALAVILIVTFCLSAEDAERMLGFWQGTLLLSVTCVVVLCLRKLFGWVITFEDPFVALLTNSGFPVAAAIISLAFVLGLEKCNHRGIYPTKLFACAKWLIGGGAAAMVCILTGMILLNTLMPGSIGPLSENPFFTFSGSWGSNRGATWKAGWMCFAEQDLLHKIIGVGPDAMEAYISHGASTELTNLVTEHFGADRLTNAHCEWLTILVNTGLMGFVGFVGMMTSAIARLFRYGIGRGTNAGELKSVAEERLGTIMGACGFCLLAYTANNMFSFQQSMSVATIFVIMGIGEACARAHDISVAFLIGQCYN